MYEFAKQMYSDEKALGIKSTRDLSLIRLRKSPAIMAGSARKSRPKKQKQRFRLPVLMKF